MDDVAQHRKLFRTFARETSIAAVSYHGLLMERAAQPSLLWVNFWLEAARTASACDRSRGVPDWISYCHDVAREPFPSRIYMGPCWKRKKMSTTRRQGIVAKRVKRGDFL